MTRLAEVKAERDEATRNAWTQHMCLVLALTTCPDHVERVRLPNDDYRYVISAYGLARADGGYVVTRGIYPGQRDSIQGYRWDDWRVQREGAPVEFRIAAERIGRRQAMLLAA